MQQVDLTKLHCLVVDDDRSFRTLLESMLRKLGMGEVTAVGSGPDALALLRHPPRVIDMILCDFSMAGGSGLELLRAIRVGDVSAAKSETCFIMVTGSAESSLVRSAAALDVNGYLVKPLSMNALRTAIARAFQKPMVADPKRYAIVAIPEDLG